MRNALVRVAERALPALPVPFERAASVIAGSFAYLLSPASREAVRANLAIIAPERRDRERMVRRVFVAQVRHYLEIFRLMRWTPEQLLERVTIRGWEHFERAHAAGRGVVMASAHLGPVTLCGQIFTAQGVPLTVPIERETSEVARSVNRARSAMGMRMIETDSALGIHRILRQGGVLAILADRAVTGVGERVPFFGREALLPSAHVALALRSGAALLPGFAHAKGHRYVAEIEAPLELQRTGDHDRDVREGVRRFAERMEARIRNAPEEWSVFEMLWDDAPRSLDG